MEEVLREVQAERQHQQQRWGDQSDDTNNAPTDWVTYISKHSTEWFNGEFPAYKSETVDAFRESMIKTAALAVAAVESLDRQRIGTGKTFYED